MSDLDRVRTRTGFLDPLQPMREMPFRWKLSLLLVLAWAWLREPTYRDGEPKQAFWFALILFAATIVLNDLAKPKPPLENQRPAGLGDFQFPTATEGRVIPLIWGRNRLSGPNVTWYDDLYQEPITVRIKTSAIFNSGKRVVTSFRYHLGVQMSLCRGPIDAIKRVWIGDVEVFSGTATTTLDIDKPDLFGGETLGAGGVRATLDISPGTTTQPVNDYLARFQDAGAGTNRTPRYTGTCFVVARELGGDPDTCRGAYFGTSTSVKPWAFEVERFPGVFSGQTAGDHKIGATDCNPMNVIYEILTNDEWGFGFPAADVNTGLGSSFVSASNTLITEGNGFAMVLDSETTAADLLAELQRQIDGVVFLDHRTGQWKVKLARADYVLGSVPQLTDDNVSEIREYTRGSWEDTTNQITVQFDKRADDYQTSFALAQDMGNALMRGGGTVGTMRPASGAEVFPGVKDSDLAANIAWRELRGHSYPLARATVLVDRTMWALTIGDVVAWTSSRLGFVQLPMRVSSVNYGRLQSNAIELRLVQDVFKFAAASYGSPPGSGWTPPGVSLVAFPAAQQLAQECPRAILVRDASYGGDPTVSKLLCAARQQGSETAFDIRERNSSGTPSGSFADAGTAFGFALIGQLSSSLAAGTAVPTTTITVASTPDSQLRLEGAFDDTATLAELGQQLLQLVLVDDEFMLVRAVANNGASVDLQNVYRGVLDSAQAAHASGANVWLIFFGSGLSSTNFVGTNNVDVELRMRSASATYAGAVTTISLTMAKRVLRPYLPSEISWNGTRYGTPSLEGAGSGLGGFRIDLTWLRRRYTTGDEVQELLADQTVDASTEYEAELRADPAGANTLIETKAWATGVGPEQFTRARILQFSPSGAVGALLRLRLRARHDVGSETDLISRQTLVFDFTPTSGLTGQFALGARAAGASSATYTAAATGTFTVNIGAAYATSAVEVNVNGGGFVSVIAAGLTTGTFSATSGQSVVLRHTVSETPSPNFVELQNPSAAAVAYGVFTT